MSFLEEICDLRKFAYDEQIIKKQRADEELLFKKKLLVLDEQALDQYYRQFQNKLRYVAKKQSRSICNFLFIIKTNLIKFII